MFRPFSRRRFAALAALAAATLAAVPATAMGVTVVTGYDDPRVPLSIAPSGESATTGISIYNGNFVAFIRKMPTTKTIDRITLGDLGIRADCTGATVSASLKIYETTTGRRADAAYLLRSTGDATIAGDPKPTTWSIPATTFHAGRGYLFMLENGAGGCGSAVAVRNWAHNEPVVDGGDASCDSFTSTYGGSYHRVWHEAGKDDWTCANPPRASNFDPSMPTGWLLVGGYYQNVMVEDRPGGSQCYFGTKAVFWRHNPSRGVDEYVCTYTQFSLPGTEVPHGWYYATLWNELGSATRDIAIRLEGPGELQPARFRPNLYFDSDENWRPLNVPAFFAEPDTTSGGSLHEICDPARSETPCEPATSTDDLRRFPTDTSYLDIGDVLGVVASPHAECNVNGLLDCNAGARTTLYYHVAPPTGGAYRYVDYWWFYRFNDVGAIETTLIHEGDWEGATLAFADGEPNTFAFAQFGGHGAYYAYLRDGLSCDGGEPGTCGSDADKRGERVSVFVANGTHASYARRCTATLLDPCTQGKQVAGVHLPETRHDGGAPWGENGSASSSNLIEFPHPGLWSEGGVRNWTNWPGQWGFDGGPESPGNQPHFNDPAVWSCGELSCGSPGGESTTSAVTANGSGEKAAPSRCGTWFGPDVSLLLCSPQRLEDAFRAGTLGRRGEASVATAGAPRAATAPGLAQQLGAPLRDGDSIRLSGSVAEDALLRLRVATASGVRQLRFVAPPTDRGAEELRVVEAGRATVLRTARGRVLRPLP